MPAPYSLKLSLEARDAIDKLRKKDPRKYKKVKATLEKLKDPGPSYPGLQSHKMKGLPKHESVFITYVENHTPSAWRVTWKWWGNSMIAVVSIHPHE